MAEADANERARAFLAHEVDGAYCASLLISERWGTTVIVTPHARDEIDGSLGATAEDPPTPVVDVSV